VIPQCLSICPSVTFTSLLGAVITLVGSNWHKDVIKVAWSLTTNTVTRHQGDF